MVIVVVDDDGDNTGITNTFISVVAHGVDLAVQMASCSSLEKLSACMSSNYHLTESVACCYLLMKSSLDSR